MFLSKFPGARLEIKNVLISIKIFSLLFIALLLLGCEPVQNSENAPTLYASLPERESLIPEDAQKMSPGNDKLPPQLHSDKFKQPIPLPFPVNTRGLEDSAFVLPDGQTLYVWFTPNNHMDTLEQSQDKVTGIYQFTKKGESWSQSERVWLEDPGQPHLDGCGFFSKDSLYFCAARTDYQGLRWLKAHKDDGNWGEPELVDFPLEYAVGELHITRDGTTVYFHSDRPGGKGGLDIWVMHRENGRWTPPVNVEVLNSERDEGWPALNPQETELWITRDYGIWQSVKVDGKWQSPELIVSTLAAEASIDQDGNVYFTHHYFIQDQMIEADIYVINRR